eukprot:TRINITY_DN36529_c0_g1_i1.p1 TRINITY_DN36529_c0_g1~~TRINITY_DN36529_c0_g1_i1.p1  ORF type:complete len:404 (+),score=49.74 TRINITY_DN36529_c0_g1_i1:64-1275(+)
MAPKYAAVAMVAAAAVGGLSTACWRCRPPERQAAELLRRIEDRLAAAEALAARAERSGEGALSADAQRAAAQLQAAAAPGGHPPPWLRHAWHGCLGRRGAPVTDEAALRAAWGEVSAAASRLRQAPRKCPPAPADCPPTTEELFVDLVLGADPRTFFPWVPVPVQWGRLADWGGEPERANRTLQLAARRLLEGLRKDVLYVTLSEAPTGLESLDPLAEDDERRAPARPRVTPAAPGLLVLSAGGFGHAAVPLAGRAAGAPLPPPGDRAGGLLLAPRPESRRGQLRVRPRQVAGPRPAVPLRARPPRLRQGLARGGRGPAARARPRLPARRGPLAPLPAAPVGGGPLRGGGRRGRPRGAAQEAGRGRREVRRGAGRGAGRGRVPHVAGGGPAARRPAAALAGGV